MEKLGKDCNFELVERQNGSSTCELVELVELMQNKHFCASCFLLKMKSSASYETKSITKVIL